MDIIEAIKQDHDEIATLVARLEPIAAEDARTSEAMRLAVKLAVALKTHAKAEERVLYAAMRTMSRDLADIALEGPYEHQALDLMLDKLLLHRPGPELRAILHVIKAMFEHHARIEEEQHVLPALERAFLADERLQLGLDLVAEKQRLRPQIERLVGPAARGTMDGRSLHVHGHRK